MMIITKFHSTPTLQTTMHDIWVTLLWKVENSEGMFFLCSSERLYEKVFLSDRLFQTDK